MKTTNVQKAKKFSKAYSKFYTIESDVDLKKNKLSLHDYRILYKTLKELSDFERENVITFNESVKTWCEKIGFNVLKHEDGVNYVISIL